MKLLASDFDGTFYFNGYKFDVFRQNVESAKKLQENNKFAIVTGRDAYSVSAHLNPYGLYPDYIAAYNGGLILDKNMKILYQDLPEFDFKRLMQVLKEERATMISMCSKGRGYMRFFRFDIIMFFSTLTLYKSMHVKPLFHVSKLDKSGIYMGSVVCDSVEHAHHVSEKIKALNMKCSVHVNRRYIDIAGQHSSKVKAVEMIEKHMQAESVYTIGDSFNDIEMIQQFHGFAVHDANDEVKHVAKIVVNSVSDAIKLLMQHK